MKHDCTASTLPPCSSGDAAPAVLFGRTPRQNPRAGTSKKRAENRNVSLALKLSTPERCANKKTGAHSAWIDGGICATRCRLCGGLAGAQGGAGRICAHLRRLRLGVLLHPRHGHLSEGGRHSRRGRAALQRVLSHGERHLWIAQRANNGPLRLRELASAASFRRHCNMAIRRARQFRRFRPSAALNSTLAQALNLARCERSFVLNLSMARRATPRRGV